MSDTLKQIAFVAGLMLVGMLAGILWHTQGGQWWLIPLLAVTVPIVVAVCVFAWAFFRYDWSH
jgi:cation transporter-like permease